VAAGWLRRERATLDRRPEVIPAEVLPLFDDPFVRTCDLYEAFVDRVVLQILDRIGAAAALDGFATAPEAVAGLGLEPDRAVVPLEWLLRRAAAAGAVEVADGAVSPLRFRSAGFRAAEDPAEIRRLQERHDPCALPAYDLVEVAAAAYPEFLRGEVEGTEVLFGPDRMGLWADYFSNSNPLYAVNNRVGAAAAARWAPAPLRTVLELGGGLGSAGVALLEALESAGRIGELERYRFTDVAMPFLRRGQRAVSGVLADRAELQMGRVDLDRPLVGQGVPPDSCDLVWAVNTIHVARDLPAALAGVREVLRPGGMLVFAECVRPFPRQPVEPELVFQLLDSFRAPELDPELRPNGGFLTPEQWRRLLGVAGFEDVRTSPDVERVRELYPAFYVGAIGAVRPA